MREKKERWRAVVGFEGIYEVSDFARVKRVGAGRGAVAGRILKQQTNRRGYQVLRINKDGKRYSATVHKLVAGAFIGVRPNGKEVNHKDGNKSNNYPDNLEYVTQSENQRHAFAMGLNSNQGERHNNSKLTEEKVHEIRRRLKNETHRSIAESYNVGRSTIAAIACGQNWSYLKEENDDERT